MLLQDVRYAFRTMRRNPGSTAFGVLILALGIGAATSVFSVVNAVLLRPVPYAAASRLAAVSRVYPQSPAASLPVSLADVEEWRRRSRQLDGIGSFVFTQVPVRIGDESLSVVTAAVDPELLPTLGTTPALGANFAGSGSTHADRSAILSYRLWSDTLNGDRGAVGRTILVNGEPYTVAGVLPQTFQFPRADASFFDDGVGLLIPVANIADGWGRSSTQWFAVARLSPGGSFDRAEAELNAIAAHASPSAPRAAGSVRVASLRDQTTRQVRPALMLIMASAAVLLLIACVNVMNLWFSRSAARGREIAIRKAIGATSWRIVRQLLTESLCLVFLAGAAGVVLARLLQSAIVALSPVHLPVSGRIEVDFRVLAFAVAVCAAAAILSGLLPAIHTSLEREHLSGGGTRISRGRTVANLQGALTISQVALGLALLTGAGLLVNSLWRLGSVHPGFSTNGVLGFSLSVPSDHARSGNAVLYERILSDIREIPGVTAVGWITNLPPEQREGVFIPFTVAGRAPSRPDERLICNFQVSSEDYFRALDIPLEAGRPFTAADRSSSAPVAMVNEALARRYFPDTPAVGQQIKTAFDGRPREIVGVIREIHDRGLGVPTVPTVYVPFRQSGTSFGSIAVRSAVPEAQLVGAVRERVRRIDPSIPLSDFEMLDARVHRSLGEPRFYTVIAAICAAMAVLFVTLGLYAVVAYSVARRTPEIGIRVAMGARRTVILGMVIWQGVRMGAIGAAIGVAISFWVTRLLGKLLFGVTPADPLTFSLATAFLLVVTMLASYVPARRASRIEPLVALRHE